MNNDINKYIKNHVMAFGAYSILAVTGIYLESSFFTTMFYACAIGIHAVVAMIGISKFPNTRMIVLKGVLLVLSIIIIGFGLCISPFLLYEL